MLIFHTVGRNTGLFTNFIPNIQSLSERMVERDSESEDEVINSTGSVEYNTVSSSDSISDSDDNESDSARIKLPLKTVHKTRSGRKTSRFILKCVIKFAIWYTNTNIIFKC